MRNYLYNRYLLILILCCFAGCASSPVKGSATAVSEGTERPSFGSTYHYSVGVLNLLDDNLDSAIKEYEKALSLDPQSSYLKTELISLYVERGEIQKAVTLSKEYLAEHPNNVNAHLLLGGLYLNRKDYKNAEGEYEKVIELDPTNTFSRVYLGTIYAETKNYKKALKTFQDLIKTSPDHLTGNYYLAKILTDMKRYEEAEQSFKKTLAIKPSFEPALIDLGLLYEKEQKVDQAVELYRSFIDLYPPGTNVRIKTGRNFSQGAQIGRCREGIQANSGFRSWQQGSATGARPPLPRKGRGLTMLSASLPFCWTEIRMTREQDICSPRHMKRRRCTARRLKILK